MSLLSCWTKNHFNFWMKGALSASMLTMPLTFADNAADQPADMAADNGLTGRPQGRHLNPERLRIWVTKKPCSQAFLTRFLKSAR